jgi:RNA polymerase-associated protein RTF1
MAAGSSARRGQRQDSVEEGEAESAPGTPKSLGSDAMDESDSDASDAPGSPDSDDGHDPLAREQRLADIAAKKDERERMDQLKGLFTEDRSGQKKRKLDDDEPKRNIRQRTAVKKDEKKKESRKTRRGSDSPDYFGESQHSAPTRAPEPVAELHNYQWIRIGRSNFAEICFDPHFEERAQGCFTRVCFQQDPSTGQNLYRMCEIRGKLLKRPIALLTTSAFKHGRPYQLEGPHGRLYMTDFLIVAGYGKLEREYPLVACSDSKFTETEFDRWQTAMTNDRLKQLTVKQAQHKLDDINFLLKHSWTPADLQQKLDNQAKFAHLVRHSKGGAVGPETLRREEALHRRNMENRKQNAKDVHAVLLRERKEKQVRNEDLRKKMDQEKRRNEDPEAAKLWEEEAERKKKIEEENKRKVVNRYVRETNNGSGGMAFARARTDDEVIGALDLDIDVNIC